MEWLGKRTRITVGDRTFEGTLAAIDYQVNAVLHGTTEYRNGQSFFVGLIMVPGNKISKVQVVL